MAFRRLSLFNVKTQPLIGTLLLVLAMSACSAEIEQRRSRELFERETKKAEHGDQVAAFHVGFLYRVGIGTTRDPEMALRWYEIAGPRGGWNAIGDMYNKGDGVARDLDQAALYYRRAADAGEPIPMYSLGCLHADGQIAAHDAIEGYMWLLLAERVGKSSGNCRVSHYECREWAIKDRPGCRARLEAFLESEQRADAEHRADAWLAKHRR